MKKLLLLLAAFGFQQLNAQLSLTINYTNTLCNSACNGTVTPVPSGGTPPYTYSWNPFISSTSAVCAGTYTCTVTDAATNTATATVTVGQPMALSMSFTSVTQATCSSGGSATAVVSGGTAPYTYVWSPWGGYTPTLPSTAAGTYTCTVTDANNCSFSGTVAITNAAGPTVSISSVTPVTCNGGCNGAASTSVTGGTQPYTYSWSPSGATSPGISFACAGNYTVTVTDSNGCTSIAMVTITQPPPVNITISPSYPTICAGSSLTMTGSGGLTYNWTPSMQTTQNITVTPAVTTTYTLAGTDAMGCVGTAVSTVYVNTSPTASFSSVEAGCNFSNGSGTVLPSGNSPFTYSWMPNGATTATANNLSAGTYSVDITDVNGCNVQALVTIGDSCDFVWPGDANDDAVADNNDILDIGIANGATGTTRANATLNWIGQPSANWGQTLLSGTDYKFVDCNGDGSIDPNDTTAVIQNFGFTHNNRTGGIPVYDASLPDLMITMGQSILASNSPGTMTVSLGNSTTPASNIYGIAFTLNFDATQIDASAFRMNENGTWMGNPGVDMMGVVMNSGAGTGSVQIAVTRLDHQDVSGFGDIANVGFMTTGDLAGSGNTQNVNFTISNVTVISANETPQTVNTVNDSVTVSDPALMMGISQSESLPALAAFPNPFNETVEIILPAVAKEKTCELIITDAAGRIVRTEEVKGNSFVMQRGAMDSGIYICSIHCGGQLIANTKLVVN